MLFSLSSPRHPLLKRPGALTQWKHYRNRMRTRRKHIGEAAKTQHQHWSSKGLPLPCVIKPEVMFFCVFFIMVWSDRHAIRERLGSIYFEQSCIISAIISKENSLPLWRHNLSSTVDNSLVMHNYTIFMNGIHTRKKRVKRMLFPTPKRTILCLLRSRTTQHLPINVENTSISWCSLTGLLYSSTSGRGSARRIK